MKASIDSDLLDQTITLDTGGESVQSPGRRILLWFHDMLEHLTETQEQKLNNFRPYLACSNLEQRCFFCGKTIWQEPALHYVIPRFFLQTDDLWNVVYTHEKCELEHQDVCPAIEIIKRLERRNQELLKELTDREVYNRQVEELQYAVHCKLPTAFWLRYKGMMGS